MDKQTYKKYTEARAPKSPVVKDCIKAFLFGGGICCAAEGLKSLYLKYTELSEDDAGLLVSVTLVFVAILLTGFGVFDKIAKHAGAGTLVPITGFANAVVSPALDTRSEGYILGVGAKIFTVAGPVILYSAVGGSLYGIIYFLISTFG